MKKEIQTSHAPRPIGPYSQAIASGDTLYVSGQIPLDEKTGELIGGDISEQTIKVMKNIGKVLEAWGAGYENLVKVTIFLTDLSDFPMMNEAYHRFVSKPYPARSTVEVSRLPKGARVEIEAIAKKTTKDFPQASALKDQI